jgi:hypothetical protein
VKASSEASKSNNALCRVSVICSREDVGLIKA